MSLTLFIGGGEMHHEKNHMVRGRHPPPRVKGQPPPPPTRAKGQTPPTHQGQSSTTPTRVKVQGQRSTTPPTRFKHLPHHGQGSTTPPHQCQRSTTPRVKLTKVNHLPPPPRPRIYTGTTINERAVRILLECILVLR